MRPVKPIMTAGLFLPLSRELTSLLRSLTIEEWMRTTVCSPWTVKDVAAHLLGGNLGILWKAEEIPASSHQVEQDYDTVLELINQENDLWVRAARRISPHMLVELLERTDREVSEHFRNLPPFEPARIGVLWAGESQSLNWFNIAREYTEKWLHQQHIREAVGRPLLLGRKWLFPVLDTFLRALPYVYRTVLAEDGTSITLEISGEANGAWTLIRQDQQWKLYSGREPNADCNVQLDPDTAWRLFTKGISPEQVQVHIEGDEALGRQALTMVSIMA